MGDDPHRNGNGHGHVGVGGTGTDTGHDHHHRLRHDDENENVGGSNIHRGGVVLRNDDDGGRSPPPALLPSPPPPPRRRLLRTNRLTDGNAPVLVRSGSSPPSSKSPPPRSSADDTSDSSRIRSSRMITLPPSSQPVPPSQQNKKPPPPQQRQDDDRHEEGNDGRRRHCTEEEPPRAPPAAAAPPRDNVVNSAFATAADVASTDEDDDLVDDDSHNYSSKVKSDDQDLADIVLKQVKDVIDYIQPDRSSGASTTQSTRHPSRPPKLRNDLAMSWLLSELGKMTTGDDDDDDDGDNDDLETLITMWYFVVMKMHSHKQPESSHGPPTPPSPPSVQERQRQRLLMKEMDREVLLDFVEGQFYTKSDALLRQVLELNRDPLERMYYRGCNDYDNDHRSTFATGPTTSISWEEVDQWYRNRWEEVLLRRRQWQHVPDDDDGVDEPMTNVLEHERAPEERIGSLRSHNDDLGALSLSLADFDIRRGGEGAAPSFKLGDDNKIECDALLELLFLQPLSGGKLLVMEHLMVQMYWAMHEETTMTSSTQRICCHRRRDHYSRDVAELEETMDDRLALLLLKRFQIESRDLQAKVERLQKRRDAKVHRYEYRSLFFTGVLDELYRTRQVVCNRQIRELDRSAFCRFKHRLPLEKVLERRAAHETLNDFERRRIHRERNITALKYVALADHLDAIIRQRPGIILHAVMDPLPRKDDSSGSDRSPAVLSRNIVADNMQLSSTRGPGTGTGARRPVPPRSKAPRRRPPQERLLPLRSPKLHENHDAKELIGVVLEHVRDRFFFVDQNLHDKATATARPLLKNDIALSLLIRIAKDDDPTRNDDLKKLIQTFYLVMRYQMMHRHQHQRRERTERRSSPPCLRVDPLVHRSWLVKHMDRRVLVELIVTQFQTKSNDLKRHLSFLKRLRAWLQSSDSEDGDRILGGVPWEVFDQLYQSGLAGERLYRPQVQLQVQSTTRPTTDQVAIATAVSSVGRRYPAGDENGKSGGQYERHGVGTAVALGGEASAKSSSQFGTASAASASASTTSSSAVLASIGNGAAYGTPPRVGGGGGGSLAARSPLPRQG